MIPRTTSNRNNNQRRRYDHNRIQPIDHNNFQQQQQQRQRRIPISDNPNFSSHTRNRNNNNNINHRNTNNSYGGLIYNATTSLLGQYMLPAAVTSSPIVSTLALTAFRQLVKNINMADAKFGAKCYEIVKLSTTNDNEITDQSTQEQQEQQKLQKPFVTSTVRKTIELNNDEKIEISAITDQLLVSSSTTNKSGSGDQQQTSKVYRCTADRIPVTLLIELSFVCSVQSIVLQSDQFVPQKLIVQLSENGYSQSFRTVKVMNQAMRKGKPYRIDFPEPIRAKWIRLIVTEGRAKSGASSGRRGWLTRSNQEEKGSNNKQKPFGSFTLKSVQVYGPPVLETDNLSNLMAVEPFASWLKKWNIGSAFGVGGNGAVDADVNSEDESSGDDESEREEENDKADASKNENEQQSTPNDEISSDTSSIQFEELDSDDEGDQSSGEQQSPVHDLAGQTKHVDEASVSSTARSQSDSHFLISKL